MCLQVWKSLGHTPERLKILSVLQAKNVNNTEIKDNLSNSYWNTFENTVILAFAEDIILKAQHLLHACLNLFHTVLFSQNNLRLVAKAYGHMLLERRETMNVFYPSWQALTAEFSMTISRVQMPFLLWNQTFKTYHKFLRILISCSCTSSTHKVIDVKIAISIPARKAV